MRVRNGSSCRAAIPGPRSESVEQLWSDLVACKCYSMGGVKVDVIRIRVTVPIASKYGKSARLLIG